LSDLREAEMNCTVDGLCKIMIANELVVEATGVEPAQDIENTQVVDRK
jgi:hypothetical protein